MKNATLTETSTSWHAIIEQVPELLDPHFRDPHPL
jgi:uncharacterized protein YbaR (Trm112 family)